MEEGSIPALSGADALDWCYRGEGAANIVLAYQGSNPLLVGKVLRLKKISSDSKHLKKKTPVSEPGKPVLSKQEQSIWADWPSVAAATSVESLIQAYARDVMSPLLGYELVDPGVLVCVSSEFLETVAHNVHDARPCWRAEASEVDTCSNNALLISDHSVFCPSAVAGTKENILSSISIEIKPKCGFLPSSALIAAENSIKKKVPRFTMHQTLKHLQGHVNAVSHYSPLDLFSGCFERINRAVHHLFENPQNNLRIFIGGKVLGTMISDSDAESPNWQPLNEAVTGCISCEKQRDAVELLEGLVSQSLYETDALRNLLAAQKLDVYDIEGAIHAYNKICQSDSDVCMSRSTMDKSVDHEKLEKSIDFLNGVSLAESRRIVRDYLIAATAKDCSLMLTFQHVPDMVTTNASMEHHKLLWCSRTGKSFYLKIHFVDLDLKPLNKMAHYYHLDQEIVRAYVSTALPEPV